MAKLDVSDILLDPDFADDNLICIRNTQTVGTNGIAVDVPVSGTFTGVVIADKGSVTNRTPDGAYVAGSILIYTTFQLRVSGSGFDADIVEVSGRQFTVMNLGDYMHFGNGFVWALCEPISFAG
jgi:hypothetical protein